MSGPGGIKSHPLAFAVAGLIAEAGAVYCARDDATGQVKIGHSVDISRQLSQLQTGSSNRLRLVAFIAGTRAAESAIHECFKDRRLNGEWFDDRDGEVTDCLIEMAKEYGRGFTWNIR